MNFLTNCSKEAWESSSKNNMADVRELIPEFFYLPDFLVNRNKFDLGIKQSGESLDNIHLPAWAKNDPREFIRVHREALESDFVSANLHKGWGSFKGCWFSKYEPKKLKGLSIQGSIEVGGY